jgi:hypothetical protein
VTVKDVIAMADNKRSTNPRSSRDKQIREVEASLARAAKVLKRSKREIERSRGLLHGEAHGDSESGEASGNARS